MGMYLTGRPYKERIIHVKRFGQERAQCDEYPEREHPLWMNFRLHSHSFCSQILLRAGGI